MLLPIVGTLVVATIGFEDLHQQNALGGPVLLMIPGLFILIPGDLLCAGTAEIAVGQAGRRRRAGLVPRAMRAEQPRW